MFNEILITIIIFNAITNAFLIFKVASLEGACKFYSEKIIEHGVCLEVMRIIIKENRDAPIS